MGRFKLSMKTQGEIPETLGDWLFNFGSVFGYLFLSNLGALVTLGTLLTVSRLGRYILSLGLAIAILLTSNYF